MVPWGAAGPIPFAAFLERPVRRAPGTSRSSLVNGRVITFTGSVSGVPASLSAGAPAVGPQAPMQMHGGPAIIEATRLNCPAGLGGRSLRPISRRRSEPRHARIRRPPSPFRIARTAERPDQPGPTCRRLSGVDARQVEEPGRSSRIPRRSRCRRSRGRRGSDGSAHQAALRRRRAEPRRCAGRQVHARKPGHAR